MKPVKQSELLDTILTVLSRESVQEKPVAQVAQVAQPQMWYQREK